MVLVFSFFFFEISKTPTFFLSSWRLVSSNSESFNFCFFSLTFISNTCSISASIFFILDSCSRFSSSIWASGFLKNKNKKIIQNLSKSSATHQIMNGSKLFSKTKRNLQIKLIKENHKIALESEEKADEKAR